MVNIGPAVLNAALGVFRVYVSLLLGEGEICGHELLLHRMSIREWLSRVEALIAGQAKRDVIYFPMVSPELLMTARRSGSSYDLLVGLDTGVFDPWAGLSGQGPGVFLSPSADDLLQFAEDLVAEAEEMS